mgnify:CR=1 FL=1
MFAVVRTGGKQYRVAAEQKITVDRLKGEVGETVQLGDILAIGEGGELKDVAGQVVSAEIVAAKAPKAAKAEAAPAVETSAEPAEKPAKAAKAPKAEAAEKPAAQKKAPAKKAAKAKTDAE